MDANAQDPQAIGPDGTYATEWSLFGANRLYPPNAYTFACDNWVSGYSAVHMDVPHEYLYEDPCMEHEENYHYNEPADLAEDAKVHWTKGTGENRAWFWWDDAPRAVPWIYRCLVSSSL